MGDEQRFSEKWDFRRQENNFDDSSSDDPDSNSNHEPLIHNSPNLVLDSKQIDDGTRTETREQPAKTRKRRYKKDESKPEKAKHVRIRKPKNVYGEENKKKEERVMEDDDDVGTFMKTLLDDLTASRESLMDWMKTELCGPDQTVGSPPPVKKKPVAAIAVKKRIPKKQKEEEVSKESEKPDQNGPEMNKPKEIAEKEGDQVQEVDCNSGPLDMFLKRGQGRNYFEQEEDQEGFVTKTEMAALTNEKSVVLAIKAPKLSQRQRKTREANRSSMVERRESKTQKDNNFVMSSMLPSFPESSLLFPSSSSQGITSFTSNNNFQPTVASSQIPDLSEFQTGYGSCMFTNNGYFSGFPAAFQPNLMAGGYNFPPQVNREDENMFGGLRMGGGGSIRFAGNRISESEVGDGISSLSQYRSSSGR